MGSNICPKHVFLAQTLRYIYFVDIFGTVYIPAYLLSLDTYGIYTEWISSHILGGIQYRYGTVTSTSAKASVAYAAPGDFAGEINIFICHENSILCFSQIRGGCGGGKNQFRCCCYR